MNSRKVITTNVMQEKFLVKSTGAFDLTRMISCLKRITGSWLIGKERVPFMVPSFVDYPELSKYLFSELEDEVVVYSVTENFLNDSNYRSSQNAVIIIKNSTEIELVGDLTQLCAPRCRYVVCILKMNENEESLLAEVENVVKTAWKSWIIKTVVVASLGGKFVVAGTRGFEPDEFSVPMRAEILWECDAPNERLFNELSVNHSWINVTAFDCPPYALFNSETGTYEGVEGYIFEAITTSLGIYLNRLNISSYDYLNMSDRYETLIEVLEVKEESDVAFCGLYWEGLSKIEYSIAYEMERVVWLVPSRPTLTLLGLITPLHKFVWFAILGLLVFIWFVKVLFFKKISFLGVMALILGVALPRQPRTLSNRIQFASLVFFGYVVTQSYLASMAGQLMNTNYQTIRTMAELESSGIKFGGTARHRDLFKIDDDEISQRIYDKYQTLTTTEYDETFAAMKAGNNRSMALVAEMKLSRYERKPGPYEPHILKEILARYPVALAVWKGFPYLDRINSKVSRLIESGLVTHWSAAYVNSSSSKVEIATSGVLKILHLSPSFLLLLLGHGLGFLVFFIEIGLYAKRTNRFGRKRFGKRKGRGKKEKSK